MTFKMLLKDGNTALQTVKEVHTTNGHRNVLKNYAKRRVELQNAQHGHSLHTLNTPKKITQNYAEY
jgi:hypothetical protein